MKTNLIDLSYSELRNAFTGAGIPAYRADQTADWIWRRGIYNFEVMTNLPAEMRSRLRENFMAKPGKVVDKRISRKDGSVKLLIEVKGGQHVEAVYIPHKERRTVCVSTQAGCKFRCVFCASGKGGFKRQLTAGEIVGQVLCARDISDGARITHVVFMGMGEPFDNYGAFIEAAHRLNHKKYMEIGARRMTVSTAGVVPGIMKFAGEGLQAELSVSLHATNDELRSKWMPINRRWPLEELMKACREYFRLTNRVITFEYVMVDGQNTTAKDAAYLGELLQGMPTKVNLIPMNKSGSSAHKPPPRLRILAFQELLKRQGIVSTIRYSKGADIGAACGQLAAEAPAE